MPSYLAAAPPRAGTFTEKWEATFKQAAPHPTLSNSFELTGAQLSSGWFKNGITHSAGLLSNPEGVTKTLLAVEYDPAVHGYPAVPMERQTFAVAWGDYGALPARSSPCCPRAAEAAPRGVADLSARPKLCSDGDGDQDCYMSNFVYYKALQKCTCNTFASGTQPDDCGIRNYEADPTMPSLELPGPCPRNNDEHKAQVWNYFFRWGQFWVSHLAHALCAARPSTP